VLDLTWVSNWPLIVSIMVFMTLFFEIYFPILIWNERTRKYWITFGVALHTGIAITMGIWSFGGIMVSAYVLFLNKSSFDCVKNFYDRCSSYVSKA
jgi:hypothetical protein